MCGRIVQKNAVGLAIVSGTDLDTDQRVRRAEARYNGAPRQELLVIRRHPETGQPTMSLMRWGLIHHREKEVPTKQPINARAETVKRIYPFADAYRARRCIVPIDAFFEWEAIKGAKAKQPYGEQDP